jgi:hypothetical protein
MANSRAQEVIEEFAVNLIEGIKDNIRNKQVTPYGAVHSTGQAEDSLFYRITDKGLVIGSTWAYITVLEDGRKPGTFAPPEAIEQWLEDKPILSDISKKSLAFLINRKMKEEGSLLYRQGGKSGILSDYTNIEYLRENLSTPLMKALVEQITGALFKQSA